MSLVGKEVLPFKAEAYQDGKFLEVTHEDFKGQWSVVVFYPADFTFVCPTELEDLQSEYDNLKELGAEVYSVSTDTHFTHKAWHDNSETIGKIEFIMVGNPEYKVLIWNLIRIIFVTLLILNLVQIGETVVKSEK